MAALQRIDRHVQYGQMVGHEEGVEFSRLELADQLLDVREIEIGVRPGAGIAPRAGVNADRPHEGAEFELAFWHCFTFFASFRGATAGSARSAVRRREPGI